MSQKIKKFFTNATKLKKITILITLFFVTLGLILPLSPVWAGLEWLPKMIANAIIAIYFSVIVWISFIFLSITSWLLGFVTGPSFITVGFTANDFVTPAWALVRDLANMGIVIALVVIGLGTALRIGEYRAKKTLPLLIFIALLINFTPVICGVIIDASNIAMNFFLGGGMSFEKFGNMAGIIATTLYKNILTTPIFEQLGEVLGILAYNILGGFIFLLFAVLFAARYVALWILVILSPFAFFSYVLPATRKFWKTWWNQFIQWTFIGVIAAFWLYLGEQIMMVNLTSPPPPSGIAGLGRVSDLITGMIPIIFLGMGLVASLSITAMGTGAIIGGAKKVEGWAKQKGKAWAGERVAGVREAAAKSEGVRKAAGWLAKRPAVGAEMKGIPGVAVRATAGTFLEFGRKLGRAGLGLQEVERKEIEAGEKEVEKASVDMVISKFRSTRVWAKKIGYINRLVKQGDIDEALDKGLNPDEIYKTTIEAKKYDAHKEMISAMPHLEHTRMTAIAGTHGISVAKAYAYPIAGVPEAGFVGKIRPARAGQVSSGVLTKPDIMEAIVRTWDGRHIRKFIETHGRAGVDAIENTITRQAAAAHVTWDAWLNDPALGNNPKLRQYIQSSAGRQFFSI